MFVFICYDRVLPSDKKTGHTVYDLYDIKEWKPIRQYITDEYKDVNFKDVPKPKNWDKMVEYASILAKGFPQVRVDLYNNDGRIYFGEMTFTSQGGRMSYWTEEFQISMGNLLKLPDSNI